MKVVEQIIVKAQPEHVRRVEKFFCDFCDKERYKSCFLCDADVCREHSDYDPEEYGDYPSFYCYNCHELKFGKYLVERERIAEEADRKHEAMDKKIKEESLALPRKKGY